MTEQTASKILMKQMNELEKARKITLKALCLRKTSQSKKCLSGEDQHEINEAIKTSQEVGKTEQRSKEEKYLKYGDMN